ncbi:VCBS domain-containing protein [Vibrio sp. SCSIO 43137]|uniref:VCBS domain-containing protein n=1 Tax=Vibrio sp. SCSIO 43137 TaxID=3021011 RepID=UPI002307A511|nr:VCBS domain-containing protein [Vibrio sp. SCSIO 43137]WCE31064.1 VCBS domain-containing protein [Vibrio sp. SCSIO 43137]
MNVLFAGAAEGTKFIILDVNGRMRFLDDPSQVLPGEVVVSSGSRPIVTDLDSIAAIANDQNELTNINLGDDIQALLAQLEAGLDPTLLGEEFAPAAGEQQGSALTTSGTIERTGAETLASTSFDTTGLESQGLSTTQSLELFQLLADAVVSGFAADSVVEAGLNVVGDDEASGKLDITDPDDGESLFALPPEEDLVGDWGTFTFDEEGNWTYTLDNTLADPLNQGDIETDVLTVTSLDGTATQEITITIFGTNDGAFITSGEGDNSVTETGTDQEQPADSTAGGQLFVSDVDDGEATFQPPTAEDLQGDYGVFTFNTDDGTWTYTIDEDLADKLNDGDVESDSLTVTSFDGTATETITVEVVGTNDGATIIVDDDDGGEGEGGQDTNTVEASSDADGVVIDPGDSSAGGKLLVQDVDEGEDVFQPVDADDLTGVYGDFSFDPDTGVWSYTLDNERAATNGLTEGQQEVDELTVVSADGTDSYTITVNVLGSNDEAKIVTVGDQDTDVKEEGKSGDGTVTEAGDDSAGGQLQVLDVDDGENVFHPDDSGEHEGMYGTFTFDSDSGVWSYTLDNTKPETQALVDGAQVQDTLTVNSFDSTASYEIVVNVEGTNDGAVITDDGDGEGGEADYNVVEQGYQVAGDPNAGGKLTVSDPDSGESKFIVPQDLQGSYGTFTFFEDGTWSYTLDQDLADPLNTDDVGVTDTLLVTSTDGTAQYTITVNIEGSNDQAIIVPENEEEKIVVEAADQTIDGVESSVGSPSTSGVLVVSDVDNVDSSDIGSEENPDIFQTPVSLDGMYGTFTFDSKTGEWSYTLNDNNPAVDALLPEDEPLTDTLDITSIDGTGTYQIEVKIEGSDDQPIVSSNSLEVDYKDNLTNLGLSAPTDVDSDNLLITVTKLPQGTVYLADGLTMVTVGMVLTSEQLTGLVYAAPDIIDPTDLDNGDSSQTFSFDAGNFEYEVYDGTSTVTGEVDVTVNIHFDIVSEGMAVDIVTARHGNDELNWKYDPVDGRPVITIIEDVENGAFIDTGELDDHVNGTKQDDLILLGEGDDYANGNEGDDIIFGESGDDDIEGHHGNDVLNGGEGNDVLKGGNDADTFRYTETDLDGSTDRIVDFNLAEGDSLDFSAILEGMDNEEIENYFDDMINTVTDDGVNSTVIVGSGSESVMIEFTGVTDTEMTNYLDSLKASMTSEP